jgi:hypothetical protein
MARKKTSISFEEVTRRYVERFPSRHHGMEAFSTKAEEIIMDYATMVERTKRELPPFSQKELNYICDMLSSTLIITDLSVRSILSAAVFDSDGLGKKWGVDPEVLSQKISRLTEFQSYVLTKIADEYWKK